MTEPTLPAVGTLGDKPDLRVTSGGAALCRFSVAATPRVCDAKTRAWRDGDPLFLACTAWRDLAENVAESLARGARVIVSGRLRQSQWEDRETGEKRSRIELDVDEVGPSLRFATATVNKLNRSRGTS